MKLADKMIAYCETQLKDESSLANIKNKVLLPTIVSGQKPRVANAVRGQMLAASN